MQCLSACLAVLVADRHSKDATNNFLTLFALLLQSELLAVIAEKNAAADRAPPHRRHAREHNATDGPQEAEVRRVRQRRE